MSELQIETISTKDFSRKLTLLGEGEQLSRATLLDYIKPYNFDRELTLILCDESLQVCGDGKPPSRISNVPPPKRGQDLAEELTDKMQKTTIRREQFINSIVEKSRFYNEKIIKAREKMSVKRVEQSQNVEKELQDRRCAAQLKREKIFQEKLEKIKTRMEYAKLIKNKKTGNAKGEHKPVKTKEAASNLNTNS